MRAMFKNSQFRVLLPLLLLVLLTVPRLGAVTGSEVRFSFESAFTYVKRAEASGGDVSALIPKLNAALQLINSGSSDNLAIARALIIEVSQEALITQVSGAQETSSQSMVVGASLVLLGASAVLIYIYGPRVFWGLWVRMKKDWVVKGS